MNLRDLKYLIAVAESKHFGKAAERCFVSQPTLSSQIKKLEEQLGVTIFERSNRSVELTPVGEAIIDHARRCTEQAEALVQTAKIYQDPLAGQLRIGAIPTLSPYLIPLIFQALKQGYPQLHPVFSDEVTGALESRLSNHEIDVAVLATPARDKGFEEIPLFDEPFWLIHPLQHPLYTKDEITREDLRDVEMLLLSDEHCLSRQIVEICQLDTKPKQRELDELRAFGLETLIQFVSTGFGCTLVPALAVHGGRMTGSGVIARKLEVPEAFRRVRLVYRPNFPRLQALQALAGIILKTLPNTVRKIPQQSA
ncbi:MAG: LysR family transcriptional regulator [Sedimenticola sp.]|jgi:LysR family hydrogen peroxide-inducible transcriptional activator|nr:MAG: LysR family transcriptional regulator [Sedimenticola sp.]